MSVLRNLESKLAGLVEGAFSRAFKSEVRPVEIARKLAREMEEHKVQSLSRIYVPNQYAVWLSPEDREQFEGYEDELRRELSGYLLEHARRERLNLVSPPEVQFRTDERLRLGEFGIQARLVRPDVQDPAGEPAQADEGRTMVYSSAERLAEPLREPDPRRGTAQLRIDRRTARPRPPGGGAGRSSAPRGRRWAAHVTARSCSTTPTSPAGTPRCGRPAVRGSCAILARPTASRSTAAASRDPTRSSGEMRSSSA